VGHEDDADVVFGDQARPRIDWTPQALSAFLDWFLSEIVGPPYSIVQGGFR
jgi:hypothetical protein